MSKFYTLQEISLCSGYSERMLRKYIKDGILVGTLHNRKWKFSEEQLTEFLDNPVIRDGLRIKQAASVMHFMNDFDEAKEESCFIYDIKGSIEEAERLKDNLLAYFQKTETIQGSFTYFYDDTKQVSRFIFFGKISQIHQFIDIIEDMKK